LEYNTIYILDKMKAKEYFIKELSGEPLTQESVIEGLENYSEQVSCEFGLWLVGQVVQQFITAEPGKHLTTTIQELFQEFLKTKQ